MDLEPTSDGMNVLQWYPTEAEARAAAGMLLERGVVADVETEPDSVELAAEGIESEVTHDGARHGVAVRPVDDVRARQILGLPEAGELGADGEEEVGTMRAMLIPVLVAMAVLVTVPLLAFFISFKLSGG